MISNTGDGVGTVALPLLAESLTRDPLVFAGVAVASRLPWLFFALQAGAIADRVDRRRLMWLSNAVRFVLMGALGIAVLADVDTIWLLYVVALLLGVAETLFDNASQAILPSVVDQQDLLETANGRLFAGEIVTNNFLGPPLGGLLFGLTAAVPILFDAGTFLISAGLIAAMTGSYVARPRATGDVAAPATKMREQIREGLSWLWSHRLLRSLAILLGFMNGTTTMGLAVFTLFAVGEESVLGLGPFGYAVLLTSGAIGSVIGSLGAERLVLRFGRGPMLWLTLLAATGVPLTIGLASNVVVVALAWIVFGFTSVVWNVITVSLRQTIIPDHLLGRVNSVYRFLGWGAMPVGALLGGLVAEVLDIRGPFLVAAGIMLVATVVFARGITSAAIDQARMDGAEPRTS